jgi:hypothetical protein
MKTAHFEPLESRQMMSVTLGRNLVVNGDGEARPTAPALGLSLTPGWDTSGEFTIEQYGSPDMPKQTSPGPANRGRNFLAGGRADRPGQPMLNESIATQAINLSSIAADVDADRISYNLSAYLGGFRAEADDMKIHVMCVGRQLQQLSAQTLTGPTASVRQNLTGLFGQAISGRVPAGTHAILIDLVATRKFRRYIDGFVDNVELKLSSTSPLTHGTVAGRVINDANGNGRLDGGEKGLAGVTVFVDKDKDKRFDKGELRATSDLAGNYLIESVPAGNVHLRQIVPGTYRATDFVARTVTVRGGLTTAAQDFGDSQTALITGNVFADADGNRRRGAAEGGLAGVKVFLDLNGNGEHDEEFERSATTDANGNYSFAVKHGTYTVRPELPAAAQQTLPARNAGLVVKVAKGAKSAGNVFGIRPI